MIQKDIVQIKKSLRQEMLSKRVNIAIKDKAVYDAWICDQIFEIISTRNAKVVHAYLPMGKEINITPLLKQLLKEGLKVVTPKTLPQRVLENRVLHDLNQLEDGVFGTKHPLNADVYEGTFDLAIVPGLAFDENNYRLGYGGGYYDNFLINHKSTYKVGVFYPFQKVTKVPVEPHDLRLNQIIVPD
jgi:5-formyltetrahydrofolate cyclo-ligase